jgi:hypothetical protein
MLVDAQRLASAADFLPLLLLPPAPRLAHLDAIP